MADLHQIIQEFLKQGYLMSLGTVDSGPWVSDVIYVYDDKFNLFWLSEHQTRHSQAINKNGQAAATITISTKGGEPNLGLQIEGVAKKIDGERYDLTTLHWQKRKKPVPPATEKIVNDEEGWYQLTPTKIEIINEPLWGFKKQAVII